MKKKTHVVTGIFGYTGQYIAGILHKQNYTVKGLTNSPDRTHDLPFSPQVSRYHFEEPEKLIHFLKGADVLYNNYWVRFNHKSFNHDEAVDNTIKLFEAAATAGIKKIIHVSITNPSKDSELPYFSGKAHLELYLKDLCKKNNIKYTILRPAVLFGKDDILINNMAWLVRNFIIVPLIGNGSCKLQPIHVQDMAQLAVTSATETDYDNTILDAIGPDTMSYKEILRFIQKAIGKKRLYLPLPDWLNYAGGYILGLIKNDVVITKEEIAGLSQNLLYTHSLSLGKTSLKQYIIDNAKTIGKSYHSELARRKDRKRNYSE